MAISVIRKADADDYASVRAAAEQFCERHRIVYYDDAPDGAEDAIECEIAQERERGDHRLRKLWTAVYCRALGRPVDRRLTIAYGHVGIRQD